MTTVSGRFHSRDTQEWVQCNPSKAIQKSWAKCREALSGAVFMGTEDDWLHRFLEQRKGAEAAFCGIMAGTRAFQTHQR